MINPQASIAGKYADVRQSWVGRFPGARVIAVGNASVLLLGANEARVWASLTNNGTEVVYLNLGEDAVLNSTLRLNPGGSTIVFDRNMPWPGHVTGIAVTGPVNILVNDVSQVINPNTGLGE